MLTRSSPQKRVQQLSPPLRVRRQSGRELLAAALGVKHAPVVDAVRDCFCHLEVAGAHERIGDEAATRLSGHRVAPVVRERSRAGRVARRRWLPLSAQRRCVGSGSG
jgi:hypothetical protein